MCCLFRVCAAVILGLGFLALGAAASEPPSLRTRWAADVDPEHPLPEYPRPQLVRANWQNLNGRWDYAITEGAAGGDGALDGPIPAVWNERAITVPYPIESALSGVARGVGPDQVLWYRRTFQAPALGSSGGDPERLVLHFGAVDHHATVYVNGREVGEHSGGYDPFWFDITDALEAGRVEQELIVRVTDPTDRGTQARGKQVLTPGGIWYTAVTGIWQTVWLEVVPELHVNSVAIISRPKLDGVVVGAEIGAGHPRVQVRVRVQVDGATVASGEGRDGEIISMIIPEPRVWSPEDPYLYDLIVEIVRDDRVLDTVASYFALRTIEIRRAEDGFPRVHLNNRPIFLLGPLDQGWWPDGLYAAPTDEALRFDIEMTRAMGFNCARKHVKVEPDRWYYWADRLGLLVLQDVPSGDGFIGPSDPDLARTPESEAAYRRTFRTMLNTLRNHPSIIAWVPFNEGWGQFKTTEILEWAARLDPTRIIDGPSGWTDRGSGQMIDAHVYPGPGMLPPEGGRASFLGEFGGLGLALPGHLWKVDGTWGYRSLADAAALEAGYAELIERLRPLRSRGLTGAIYTQTTDVEIEVNGLMTYDREVAKIPVERLAAINARAFVAPPTIIEVAPTSEAGPADWRFTTTDPGPGWQDWAFDDSAWPLAPGGFGTRGTPGANVWTIWDTPQIWIRRSFIVPRSVVDRLRNAPAGARAGFDLRLHHDEDVEVYLNGVLIHSAAGYQTGYIDIPLEGDQTTGVRPGPDVNVLAVRCTQTRGGQYIDAGIVLTIDPAPGP